jgi:glyoxylase-like metal-dependent hydrolase (beta-lactamase superfamily II)
VTLVPVPSLHAKGCLDVLAEGFLFVGDALYSRDSGTGLYYNHEIAYEMLKTYQKIPFAVAIPAHQDNEKSKAEVLAYLTALEQSESALH